MQTEVAEWGSAPITEDDAAEFARRVPTSEEGRAIVTRTLFEFPLECEVRGMFFQGLVDTIGQTTSRDTADRLVKESGVSRSFIPFALMPHRDFYKLYFLASATLFPKQDLAESFERIAEDFYPTFRDSMIGKTLSAFVGRDPLTVLERLAQAYRMSIPWNEHDVVTDGRDSALWRCKVEPSELYPSTFHGIIKGTMRSHGVREPSITLLRRRGDERAMRYEYSIRW